MHEVLVNRLGGLSLPRKSVVRLTDRPDMTLDVYRGRKTTKQQQQQQQRYDPQDLQVNERPSGPTGLIFFLFLSLGWLIRDPDSVCWYPPLTPCLLYSVRGNSRAPVPPLKELQRLLFLLCLLHPAYLVVSP